MNKLTDETQACFRAGVRLPSIVEIVDELIENSINARARKIRVIIDFSRVVLTVIDDGVGIEYKRLFDFEQECKPVLAPENCSSGFSGNQICKEGLSNILMAGAVSLTSKAAESSTAFVKILNREADTESEIREPEATGFEYESGTKITFFNWFDKFPVRRKQLLDMQKCEQLRIKKRIQEYALLNPSIEFYFFNIEIERALLALNGPVNIIQRIGQVYSEAVAKDMEYVYMEYDGYVVNGCLSVKSFVSNFACVAVNNKVVSPAFFKNLINQLVLESNYGKTGHVPKLSPSNSKNRLSISEEIDTSHFVNKRRRNEISFVLFIECASNECTTVYDPLKQVIEFKNRDVVQRLLSLMIIKFLKRHDWISLAQMQALITNFCKKKREKAHRTEKPIKNNNIPLHDIILEPNNLTMPNFLKNTNRPDKTKCIQSRVEHHSVSSAPFSKVPNQRMMSTTCNLKVEDIWKELAQNNTFGSISGSNYKIPLHDFCIEIPKSLSDLSEKHLKISPDDLEFSSVVGQLDKKFIICSLNTKADNVDDVMLLAIDQHAADERIRLEDLFEDLYFVVLSIAKHRYHSTKKDLKGKNNGVHFIERADGVLRVDQGLEILLEPSIAQIVLMHLDDLVSWGFHLNAIEFEAAITSQNCTATRFRLCHIPAFISARILKSSKVISHLIVSMCTWFESAPLKKLFLPQSSAYRDEPNVMLSSIDYLPFVISNDGARKPWMDMVCSCPPPLIYLLESVACRSAIKFNDELSINECKILLKKLSSCYYSFYCAHGRPSAVPLLKLKKECNPPTKYPLPRWRYAKNLLCEPR